MFLKVSTCPQQNNKAKIEPSKVVDLGECFYVRYIKHALQFEKINVSNTSANKSKCKAVKSYLIEELNKKHGKTEELSASLRFPMNGTVSKNGNKQHNG